MSDEMFRVMMIPVVVLAFHLLIVKPLAWLIERAIKRIRENRAHGQKRTSA